MQTRTTKRDLQNYVAQINNLTGETFRQRKGQVWYRNEDGELFSTVGVYKLDIANGGYQLVRIMNEGGGETEISPRLSAKELKYFMQGMLYGLTNRKNKVTV